MRSGKLLGMIRRRTRLLKARRAIIWGIGLLAAYTYIGGPSGLIHYQQLKNRERAYQRTQRELTAQVVGLEQEIEHLKTDTLYIEKVVRERYGYVRPGERVYRIISR